MKFTALATLILCCNTIFAQYKCNFDRDTNGVYTELNAATNVTSNAWQEQDEFTVQLGFYFHFIDKSYNTVTIQPSAGILLFGTENMIICGSVGVLFKDKGTNTTQSPISYKTDVVNGKKIFKVQFKNLGFIDGNSQDYWNFQLWLYEGSNKIEYRFGSFDISVWGDAFGGYLGPVIYLAKPDPQGLTVNAVVGVVEDPDYFEVSGYMIQTLIGIPKQGTIYSFQPLQFTSVEDAAYYNNASFYYTSEKKAIYFKNNVTNNGSTFSLTNLLGQQLLEVANPKEQIDLSNVPPGSYIANLFVDGRHITKHIFVQ